MFIGLSYYITKGKAVFLFYTTQLPCRSRVIILWTSSYHRSAVIYIRQLSCRYLVISNRRFPTISVVMRRHALVISLGVYWAA